MTTCAPLTKSPNCPSQMFERVRRRRAVAVLEAEDGLLGQQRIGHHERARIGRHVRERRISIAGRLIDQCRVAMEERAAPAVLADEPHVEVRREQRRVGQAFGEAPIATRLACRHAAPILDDPQNARMELVSRRHRVDHAGQPRELRIRQARVDGVVERRLVITAPVDRVLVADHAERGLIRIATLVEGRAVVVCQLVDAAPAR